MSAIGVAHEQKEAEQQQEGDLGIRKTDEFIRLFFGRTFAQFINFTMDSFLFLVSKINRLEIQEKDKDLVVSIDINFTFPYSYKTTASRAFESYLVFGTPVIKRYNSDDENDQIEYQYTGLEFSFTEYFFSFLEKFENNGGQAIAACYELLEFGFKTCLELNKLSFEAALNKRIKKKLTELEEVLATVIPQQEGKEEKANFKNRKELDKVKTKLANIAKELAKCRERVMTNPKCFEKQSMMD